MPRSMTAFARTTQDFAWGNVSCELRSVNHRFLEINFKMPETLRGMEFSLREALRKELVRGKVDCTLQVAYKESFAPIEINIELAEKYIRAAENLASIMTNPAPLSALEIMRWPEILKEPSSKEASLEASIKEIFSATCHKLVSCRQREGDELSNFIAQKLIGIEEQLVLVRRAIPEILARQRKRLNDRLLAYKNELDNTRVEQEMVLIISRADVQEELDRLETHVIETRRVLATETPIGRRLDFLMQELNREANTLGSKSLSDITTQASVELKVLIEQIREQIQNIE